MPKTVNDSAKPKRLYDLAGIDDVAEFYRARYVSSQLLDGRYFHALNRFDVLRAHTIWIYDNVRRGARVLDLGCGSGVLALLKRKGVTLVGVDLSNECAETARRNGYDQTRVADLNHLPFPNASFDYVVSLDVMGHVEFDEKDAVLAEIVRVMKPDGVTMHGIEVMNRDRRKDYDQMSDEEVQLFVAIDGHVGMESQTVIHERWSRFFPQVQVEPRHSLCQSAEELIKQADEYGAQLCDSDLLNYLRGLSFGERRAFDMAMGYVFNEITAQGALEPVTKSEYLFLKASQAPLGNFHREHYDRSDLFPQPIDLRPGESRSLDETTAAEFDGGWYEAENFPPVARWMGPRAKIIFSATLLKTLSFDIATNIPDVNRQPLQVEFLLNGERIRQISLEQNGWHKMELGVPQMSETGAQPARLAFEIRVDRTWQPCSIDAGSKDDRELSVAVANLRILA